MTLCYIAWCLLVFYSLFSCLSCSLTFLDFRFFDHFVWYLQYWIAALVFFAIIGSLPWCTVSSYPACHVYVKYSSAESFFFFFFLLACSFYNVRLLLACDWLWLVLCDLIPLCTSSLSLSLSTSLAHSNLLFYADPLFSLENVWWNVLLPPRSLIIEIESEELAFLSWTESSI